MIRLNRKYRKRVSNRTALVAALLLAMSTAVTLQGNALDPAAKVDPTQPIEASAAQGESPNEAAGKNRKINLKVLLFRHG